MAEREWEELFDERAQDSEGVFDDQLLFEAPFVEAPSPIRTITKRDGREVPFEVAKIADTIDRASASIGVEDKDRAKSLARAVALYLKKTYNGSTPTVDNVHDAVEKVLVEMGHTRTALAYVRYRDKRARIRQLQGGDAGALVSEWLEARAAATPRDEQGLSSLFVRTSEETLAAWDRERIVGALVRETGLDNNMAQVIALEVEHQIQSAGVKSLTAPLIRELVGARLIEHGLDLYERRHRRLGVPLYDATQIICGPHAEMSLADPALTDRLLAESVKREFALAQVFSTEVADAHMSGDIHIQHLGFVDRLHSSLVSLEYVKLFGAGMAGRRELSRPPRYPETLLGQMLHFHQALQAHYAGPIGWDALDVFMSPFLHGLTERDMRQAAQMLIFQFAHHTVSQGGRVPPAELTLCWEMPSRYRHAPAIGPGGEYMDRFYGDFGHTVQQFAQAVVDVLKEGGAGGVSFPGPALRVLLTPEFFKVPGHEAFLERVGELAVLRGGVEVLFERHGFDSIEPDETWQPRQTAVQCITLNLPRAAYRARTKHAHDERILFQELDRVSELVAQAHIEKRRFLQRLLAQKDAGPLALLAMEQSGIPYLDMDQATHLVSVTGLNECVETATGHQIHESREAATLGVRIAEHLSRRFADLGEHHDLTFVLAQCPCPMVSRRLAMLDLREFGDRARPVVKMDTEGVFYTAGARVNSAHAVNPLERVLLEGQFHEWFADGAVSWVSIPDGQTSAESMAVFLRKAYLQTQSRRIGFLSPAKG